MLRGISGWGFVIEETSTHAAGMTKEWNRAYRLYRYCSPKNDHGYQAEGNFSLIVILLFSISI